MNITQEGEERFGLKSPEGQNSTWEPVFRSGSWSDKGPKRSMEDEFICVDDLKDHIGSSTGAFYGVTDRELLFMFLSKGTLLDRMTKDIVGKGWLKIGFM